MANYNYESLDQDPWGRTAQNLGQIFAQQSRNRYLQEQRVAQGQRQQAQDAETTRVNSARIGLTTEQTRKTKLSADKLAEMQAQQRELVGWVRTNIVRGADGSLIIRPEAANAMGQFLSSAIGSSRGGNDAALTFKNISGAVNAPVEAEKNRNAAGERNELAVQGRLAGALARPGPDAYEKVVESYPAEKEKPVVVKPEQPAKNHWFSADEPFVPGITNIIPAKPKMTITRTLPVGSTGQRLNPLAQAGQVGAWNAGETNAPAAPQEFRARPTRALARDYVARFGTNAVTRLQADGYDATGYAD